MTTGIIKTDNGQTNLPAASFSGLIDRVFQHNLNRFFEDDFWGFNGINRQNQVPVNITETDKSYELQLVAPGLKKEDFKISLEGDLLTISHEHKEENSHENKTERWLRKEYRMQTFSRSFNLDEKLDSNKISAQYRDGILHLNLPKKEGAQRLFKTIEIK